MRVLTSKLFSFLFRKIEPNNADICEMCKNYMDRFRGENNDDIRTNGELDVMKTLLPRAKVVLDVGANVGDWAAIALDVNPHIEVHCFEPSHETYKRLVARTFPSNVRCLEMGLSSAKREASLYIFGDGSGLNSLYQRKGLDDGWGIATPKRREIVRLDTVDNYRKEYAIDRIDYMKVDVEGHELDVFRGAEKSFSEGKIEVAQFEYGGCNIDSRVLLKDIFDFFEPLEYTFLKIFARRPVHVERYDQRLENFQYQNWLIVKKNEIARFS